MDIKGTCIATTTDEHGTIYVYENRTSRILSFDGKIYQSCMKLNNINGLNLEYTRAMMAGLFFIPTLSTATIMGLGAGSMVKNLLSSFSDLNIHAVEYRQAVAQTAQKHFNLPITNRLVIHIDDAMHYIKNTSIKSDIIFSDLYNSAGMDAKQVQLSYLRDCKNALHQHGVLVLNICHTSPELQQELDQLLSLEFNQHLIKFEVRGGNTIVLAFKNDIPLLTRAELLSKAQCLANKMNILLEPYAKVLADMQGL